MSRIIIITILILIVGGVLVYFLSAKNGRTPFLGEQPGPTTNTGQPSDQRVPEEQIERLRTRLFEEGVDVVATVETVYPGIGFIMRDDRGGRVFVHSSGDLPSQGQNVTVKGIVKRVNEENLQQLRTEEGFTSELGDFLGNQRIYLEAQSVDIRLE